MYRSFRYRSTRHPYETSLFSFSGKGNLTLSALHWETGHRAQRDSEVSRRSGADEVTGDKAPPVSQPGTVIWAGRSEHAATLTMHTSATTDRKRGTAPRSTKGYASLVLSKTALFLLHHFHQLKIYAKNFCSVKKANWTVKNTNEWNVMGRLGAQGPHRPGLGKCLPLTLLL